MSGVAALNEEIARLLEARDRLDAEIARLVDARDAAYVAEVRASPADQPLTLRQVHLLTGRTMGRLRNLMSEGKLVPDANGYFGAAHVFSVIDLNRKPITKVHYR